MSAFAADGTNVSLDATNGCADSCVNYLVDCGWVFNIYKWCDGTVVA